MNSGLPSLLDAIFGKQDLDLVSLDEIYEVIREFPSFNAGHFLLAKKLKLQEDPGYEVESMRTALYFNNPFWLQSLLDDGNHFQRTESAPHVKEIQDEDQFIYEEKFEETPDIIQAESNYTFESYTPIEQPVIEKDELDEEIEQPLIEKDELDEEAEEILEEKLNSDPERSEETFQYTEPGSQTVTSFDELMAKYNLKPLDMVDETAEAPEAAVSAKEDVKSEPEVAIPVKEDAQSKPEVVQEFKLPVPELNPDKGPATDSDQFERLEEVVNEYGIFEEIVAKKADQDFDMDAFDEPLDQIPFVSDKIVEETNPANHSVSTSPAEDTQYLVVDEEAVNMGRADSTGHPVVDEEAVNTKQADSIGHLVVDEEAVNMADADSTGHLVVDEEAVNMGRPSSAEHLVVDEEAVNTFHETGPEHLVVDEETVNPVEITDAENTGIVENATIIENQESEDAPHQTDEHDYDAFDRPPEEPVQTESLVSENSSELSDYDPDNTGEPVEYSDESESGANGQMQELSDRFGEHQKLQSSFNAKNADSIVFTPYHMVDYFASQGIKLILEDNPPDQFGKQLKSFTDWLKVMKKLPARPSSEKEDEKENEQIRHFAAHSIEERDILTESMAEVLAKQGMYENAIALFQKLSLIYPPKSAYFASRIEQLKASLP